MLRVFSRTLTRPRAAGSRPSPAPARRSFLHAPSTPHGTSCNSPEEGDTNKHRCYWSQLKCTGEEKQLDYISYIQWEKKGMFLLLSHLCLCIRKVSVFPALFQRCILLPSPCIMHYDPSGINPNVDSSFWQPTSIIVQNITAHTTTRKYKYEKQHC